MKCVISWAQYHNVNIIPAVPEKHYGWVNKYFGQYCAHIILYEYNQRNVLSGLIPIASGNIVAMDVVDIGFAGKYMPIQYYKKYHDDLKFASRCANIDLINPKIIVDDDVKSLFKKYQLKPNKTIILSLTSQSQQGLVFSYEQLVNFWADLIKTLQQYDFQIVINAPSSENKDYSHLKNALALHIPLEQIVPFVNYGGYFIGERSGLCDMLSISDAKRYFIDLKGYIEYEEFAGFKAIHVNKRDYQQNIDWLINDLLDKS